MKRFLPILLVLTTAGAAAGEQKIEMIMTGDWHGEEIRANAGEQWLALTGTRLQPVRIGVELVHDGIIDMPGEKTAKRVTAADLPEYSLLLRGVTPRSVAIAERADLLQPMSGAGQKVQLLLGTDTVTVETRRAAAHEEEGESYEIVLSGGGITQLIGRSGVEEIALLWSGDLDADGRIDLIVDASDHYNVFAPTLFLTSAATDGEIVGRVAEFVTSGC